MRQTTNGKTLLLDGLGTQLTNSKQKFVESNQNQVSNQQICCLFPSSPSKLRLTSLQYILQSINRAELDQGQTVIIRGSIDCESASAPN